MNAKPSKLQFGYLRRHYFRSGALSLLVTAEWSALREVVQLRNPPLTKCSPEPFREKTGIRAATIVKISCASTFRGSLTSVARHASAPNTQATPNANVKAVPRKMSNRRGGNAFLSGT